MCEADSENDHFPTLGVLVSGEWFLLSPKDYLFYQPVYGMCAVLIANVGSLSDDMWVMGDPFLRAYYSIYDMENTRIGLVGLTYKL